MSNYEEYISATLKVLTALLKLGNWTIDVKSTQFIEDASVITDYRYQRATIYMPNNLTTPAVDVRLVHECLHIVLSGMGNVHRVFNPSNEESKHMFTDAEEHAIKTLEGIVLETLRQTIKDGVQ